MEYSAKAIAELLNGSVDGNSDVTVSEISKIEEGKPGTITFLANPKYTKFIYTTNASIVIVSKNFIPEHEINSTLVRVENPYQAFAHLLEAVSNQSNGIHGISELAYIHNSSVIPETSFLGAFAYVGKNCVIGQNVKIYPHVFLGDGVEIGDNSILYSGVKIFANCKVGNSCIIHGNTVIGSDGFGFARNSGTEYEKIPQIGNVIIGDNVEIGANSCIDRATMGSTVIHKGVKLDNLIQVAHNVEIGENTVIASQTGIAGSTKIGKNCIFGGQVGIVGHIQIANEVKIAAQSGVANNIKEKGAILQGSPAYNIKDYQRSLVMFRKLPDLFKQINKLEKEIKRLKGSD